MLKTLPYEEDGKEFQLGFLETQLQNRRVVQKLRLVIALKD